jgi:queuine tRNA-ribosyltransferase
MKWPLPILTDSGGYQAFTLIHGSPHLKGKVTDEGAFFRNPLNGDKLELTPEKAIDIQFNLGSDIMVVLDDCRHYMDHKEMEKSVYRTIEWAKRCKEHFLTNLQTRLNQKWEDSYRPQLFAVVQGGIDLDLRKMCAEKLVEIGFDGYSFGGWAINEKEYFPYEPLEYIADILPEDKPRYAMGIGTPENMEACINYGYDLFDCVIPSRNGRHGLAYTTEGVVNIKNSKYKADFSPLEPNLDSTAADYEKYYLHHLFKIKDALGGELLTIQNLQYFNYVMQKLFEDKQPEDD